MPIDVARYARDFSSLQFHAPEAGILELVMANKGRVNAATEAMHGDLARVWRAIDTDDAVRAVVVRGGLAAAREKRRPAFDRDKPE
jgi:enoyl-CoA hydratase